MRNLTFDQKLSEDLIDLITKMLAKNPLTRITLPEIFEHSWIQRYERILGTSVADFRLKSIKGEKNEGEGEENKSLLKSQEKCQESEEGFSPQLSPTRKLKKKPLLTEMFAENREKGIISENGNENLGPRMSFLEVLLRKLGNLCKC